MTLNYLNYTTNKAHMFDIASLKEEETLKEVKKIFDKSDLLSDE